MVWRWPYFWPSDQIVLRVQIVNAKPCLIVSILPMQCLELWNFNVRNLTVLKKIVSTIPTLPYLHSINNFPLFPLKPGTTFLISLLQLINIIDKYILELINARTWPLHKQTIVGKITNRQHCTYIRRCLCLPFHIDNYDVCAFRSNLENYKLIGYLLKNNTNVVHLNKHKIH